MNGKNDAAKAFCEAAAEGIAIFLLFAMRRKLLEISGLQIAKPWNADFIKLAGFKSPAKLEFKAVSPFIFSF